MILPNPFCWGGGSGIPSRLPLLQELFTAPFALSGSATAQPGDEKFPQELCWSFQLSAQTRMESRTVEKLIICDFWYFLSFACFILGGVPR